MKAHRRGRRRWRELALVRRRNSKSADNSRARLAAAALEVSTELRARRALCRISRVAKAVARDNRKRHLGSRHSALGTSSGDGARLIGCEASRGHDDRVHELAVDRDGRTRVVDMYRVLSRDGGGKGSDVGSGRRLGDDAGDPRRNRAPNQFTRKGVSHIVHEVAVLVARRDC